MKTTIANPIYDIVFKYLLEDMDIAKGLLSTILDVEIIDLTVTPQEIISEHQTEQKNLRVYRVDFATLLKQPDGTTKKVLIELQKSKRYNTAKRFRAYLAENYQREDTFTENGIEKKQSLEIIAIYILGFALNKTNSIVLHGKPCFRNVISNQPDTEAHLDDFVRLLTHESYFIQTTELIEPTKTRLEKILSIFNQAYKTTDEHALYYETAPDDDPLLKKMLSRLTRAIADEDMRRKMDLEDEIDREFEELQEAIEQNKRELEQSKHIIEQKDQELEQNKQELEQNKQELEFSKRLIEELQRQLAERDKKN